MIFAVPNSRFFLARADVGDHTRAECLIERQHIVSALLGFQARWKLKQITPAEQETALFLPTFLV
jgi:hypothetical protein